MPDVVGAGTRPVVIVGAGPVGLAMAGLLAGHGITAEVLERRAEPYQQPRAVHLDGAAVRVLQGLGVAERFAAISRPASGLRLLDAGLRPFARFDRATTPGRHGHPDANLFDQPDLEALLRAGAPPVRGGVVVTGVDAVADGVRVTVHDVATDAREQLTAAAVVGCDGAGSTVRTAIGAQLRDRGFAQRWLVVDVRSAVPLPTWSGIDQVCDPRRAATVMHVIGDRYRFEFRMHPRETEAELVGGLAALTAPWLGAVPRDRWEVLRSAEYVFHARVADHWRRGRVFLAGDAAHLMPPFIGQGLGTGLGDAHNLAWKLAAVLAGRAGEDLLDTYRAERAPHAEAVIRAAVRVGRAMTGGNDLVAALRRPVAGALLRLPGVRARAVAGFETRYPASAWVERRTRRADLAGTVCPQPVVRVDGRAMLLDDVLGPGYALLRAGPVDPRLAGRAQVLGARRLRLGSGAGDEVSLLDDGTLRAWLDAGRASAVLLRPDRVVSGATRRGGHGQRPGPSW